MNKLMILAACAAILSGCNEVGDIVLAPDGEIRTPAVALAKARELKASGAVKGRPVEIWVKPGRYQLTEPLVLTAADSDLRIRGLSARTTVFDGGHELKPFSVGLDGVWVTDVPEGLEFDQLWVGDHRAQRAFRRAGAGRVRRRLTLRSFSLSLKRRSFGESAVTRGVSSFEYAAQMSTKRADRNPSQSVGS